jgi:hypothetical protein
MMESWHAMYVNIAAILPGQFIGKAPKQVLVVSKQRRYSEYPIEESIGHVVERADSSGADVNSASLGML